MPDSTSASARKFCERAWRARSPAARSVARTWAGSIAAEALTTALSVWRAAARAGHRGRAALARRPRSVARRRRRSSPRCRCTGRAAGRSAGCRRPSASPASRSRRQLFAATPPPSTIERAPISRAARAAFVASTSTTASWKPHASSAVVASLSGVSASSGAMPSAVRASLTIFRAAVFSPEKLRSYESPIQARGKRTSRLVAPSAAFWMAGPPG